MYTEWYFKLCELCEKKEARLQPLSHAEASHLEIVSNLFATKVQPWRQICSDPLSSTSTAGSAGAGGQSSARSRVILS